MLDDDTLDIADRWWARDFACPADGLRPASTVVQEHVGALSDWTGIWILVVGSHPRISLPHTVMAALAERAADWSRELVTDHAALTAAIAPIEVETIVGPAPIAYGTALDLDLSRAGEARALLPTDAEAISRLRNACSDEAWDHGGSDPAQVPTFGYVDERGEVLALAGYKTWGCEIAHLSIVAAPGARGLGLATAAVACAAQHALDQGLLPQYRTLGSNAASLGIAKRLGFEAYGVSVYVRLAAA